MMRLPMILVVASAEMRSTRRLFRYWLFVVLSTLTGLSMFLQLTIVHGLFSNLSATVGAIGPRYLISGIGTPLLTVFLAGLIFLAFDVRARDERDRMIQVLDARPLSNAEFLLGRVCGLVFLTWLPVLIMLLLFSGFGFIAMELDLPIGDPIEPLSLIGFLLGSLLSILLWCSIIVLMAIFVRYRLLVVILAMALLGFQFWGTFNLPLYLQPVFSVLPSSDMASDILPRFFAQGETSRLLAQSLMVVGILAISIALYPRNDGHNKFRTLGIGAGFLVLSGLGLGFYVNGQDANFLQQNALRAVHESKQTLPRPDMQSVTGTLDIQPGDNITMTLDIKVQAPREHDLSTLLFTLNPGLTVHRVTVAGEDTAWQHAQGMLAITPPYTLGPGSYTTITLHASGVPDEFFGYLDTHVNVYENDSDTAQLGLLGYKTSIFESGYIAMMPGGHWLPSPGTDVPQSDPRTHPYDYYLLDLEVEIPADWQIAGPGRSEALDVAGDTRRFRFNPSVPLPQVGLIASRFERRTMTADGIEFELLLHPKHARNLHFFAESENVLRERITALFSSAENMGLPYPYDGLSLVEIPNVLRGYGGGWRMDTVQAMPGLLALRESGFPISRFEFAFRKPGDFEDKEGGIGQAKLDAVENFFENDLSGGNLFTGGSRNFLLFQTSARGEGAIALNFLLEELTSQLITDRRGYFSAHEFHGEINLLVGRTITEMVTGRSDSIADSVHNSSSNRPSVWDRALGASLAELEPGNDPGQSLNVLSLKCRAIANAILDGLGREKTAEFLSELVRQFRGRHFNASDFYRIAAELDTPLEPLLGDWLHDAALPGFLVSSVESVRLTDGVRGNPRYQTRVHVRNDEPVPGLMQLKYTWSKGKKFTVNDETDPVLVPAKSSVEVGVLTITPLDKLWLAPYLSLNRQDVLLKLPQMDLEQRFDAEPLTGARESHWQPPQTNDIVVDDLDPGFSLHSDNPITETRAFVVDSNFGGGTVTFDMDQGLPEHVAMYGYPERWSRSVNADSWGKYRHTHAVIKRGNGDRHVVFTTELPDSGLWRLSYHLPLSKTDNQKGKQQQNNQLWQLTNRLLGEYRMELVSDGNSRPVEFDGNAASPGWNDLGEFQLPAGKTDIMISDDTTGSIVIADAISWRRVSGDD